MNEQASGRANKKHSNLYYVRSVLGQVWRHPSNADHRLRSLAKAVGWQIYKRVTGRPITIRFGDFKVRCYPDTGSAANVIYFTERFDPEELHFMERYLRPGDGFVDVGANVGLYSLWAAGLVGRSGRIDAFEAAPKTAQRLRENVALNGLEDQIVVHELAASDQPGTLEFYVDFDVSNGLVPASGERSKRSRSTLVKAMPLDELLPDRTYALGKIDVEGAEVLALTGWAAELRAANPPVFLLEILSGQLERQGTSVSELVALLNDLGFSLFQHPDEVGDLFEVADPTLLSGNALAIHRDQIGEVRARLGQG